MKTKQTWVPYKVGMKLQEGDMLRRDIPYPYREILKVVVLEIHDKYTIMESFDNRYHPDIYSYKELEISNYQLLTTEEQSEEWPKNYDEYYYLVDEGGTIWSDYYHNTDYHNYKKELGNMFRTREEAERYELVVRKKKL